MQKNEEQPIRRELRELLNAPHQDAGRQGIETSFGRISRNVIDAVMALESESERSRARAERMLQPYLKETRLKEILTANPLTRIMGLRGDTLRIVKYRVMPLIVKRLELQRSRGGFTVAEVDEERLRSSYELQRNLLRSYLHGQLSPRVAAPGMTLTYLLEFDYCALGAVTLEDLLRRFKEYRGEGFSGRGNAPMAREQAERHWAYLVERIIDVRFRHTAEMLATMGALGYRQRPSTEEERNLFGKKLQSSLASVTRFERESFRDAASLHGRVLETLSDEPWEPYYDPSDANILYLPAVSDPAARSADFKRLYIALGSEAIAGTVREFAARLIHTDFERCLDMVPRIVQRLHDLVSPGMNVDYAGLLRLSPQLTVGGGASAPPSEEVIAAGVAYRAAREASHYLERRKTMAEDDVVYYLGLLRAAERKLRG